MSILNKVKEMLGRPGAREGIDRAAKAAKKATGGKYDKHIDKGAQAARDTAEKLNRKERP
ncbi:MAG: antitoxin [Nonomuraea sp.]|nr:antitoxin [Nonomuraea sp.]NUP65044.1 antitoxin [Nonomuraea sp.]NUP76529.1 antitoxin [Nonomuraea sp.]NUS07212.1 antitoxin [Nonomuraea sp.]NUT41095.1 antitoxin [Thermoactinospora sp.]